MLRGLLSKVTRGGAAGRARPAAGAPGPTRGTRGTRGQDEPIGRGVRKLLRRGR